MRIKAIHIYGFGKFIDFHLEDLQSFQVFFGENEAGKSTLMAFIHCMLFGFPSKQQMAARYEPKKHSAYGGKLILDTPEFGIVEIERVKGKSSGDVFVTLDNGRTGNEPLLQEVLQGIDKPLYESIFSFNLEGLQNVHRLKDEEITKYLIAIGTLGSDVLLQMEQSFQKDLDRLFKPSGRKPILNQQLSTLREADKQLKSAQQQNDAYETLSFNRDEVLEQIEETERNLHEQLHELQSIEELVNNWPLIQEKNRLQMAVKEMEPFTFPPDGLARFEYMQEKIISLSSRIKPLKERIAQINKTMEENVLRIDFQQSKHEIERIIESWSQFNLLREQLAKVSLHKNDLEELAMQISRDIQFPVEKWPAINQINLGLDMKGKIKEGLQEEIRLKGKIEDCELQLREVNVQTAKYEGICKQIEKQMLSEKEFKKLSKKILRHKEKATLLVEKEAIEQQLEQWAIQTAMNKQKDRNNMIVAIILLIINLFIAMWGFISSLWMNYLIAILASIYPIYNLYTIKTKSSNSHLTRKVAEQKARLKEVENTLDHVNVDENETRLYEHQLQLRDEWKTNYLQMEQSENRKHVFMQQKQELLKRYEVHENLRIVLRNELGLNANFSLNRLDDGYERLKQLADTLQQLDKLNERHEKMLVEKEEWIQRFYAIYPDNRTTDRQLDQHFFKFKEIVQLEEEKTKHQRDLLQQLEELETELHTLEIERNQYEEQFVLLKREANVTSEKEFRNKADHYQKYVKMKERLTLLEEQLQYMQIADSDQHKNEVYFRDRKRTIEQLYNDTRHQLHTLRQELATIQHQLQLLEEGGTYTEKLHQYYHLRSIFNEDALQWAKMAIAKSMLNETMNTFKRDRFPKVIEQAEAFFAFLTDDEYEKIYFNQSGELFVVRKDGVRFHPAELSKGTGEQLYTALRFGLVYVLSKQYVFPVIIDDGFVNFDKDRTTKMIQLLENINQSTQVFIFTCHDHIKSRFTKETVIHLSAHNKGYQHIHSN